MSSPIALTEVLADNQHKKEIGMNEQPNAEMSQEDRLKAVLYQFITLYERWAEDRQLAAKQGADIAESIKLFRSQVQNFKFLGAEVRQEINDSIEQAATSATKEITQQISKIATHQVDASTKNLQKAVEVATHQLGGHQQQIDHWFYGWIAGVFGAAVIVAVLVAHWMIPVPYLPLTGQQLQTYEHGRLFEALWPKLSKKEQNRLMSLAKAKDKENAVSDSTDNINNTDNIN